eukprot:gnl/TRDRNA2_/TRDRNA2_28864_c0_seq1.p1 gnl/TRDRNA2_/TRDRNA2_28864_c0~~gnl/TRDRNA2_/TRDRNA2_28864_c0_seq1.p1  ORF type:complete len:354 (-),score=37.28 gnl/TRDRNA2_/TRDRNA2_28864_c0_seq1:38-1099(-)
MPLYEEKLISPLAVHFSQTRIRPTFQDGYPVAESLAQIQVVAPGDSTGYDLLLDAPFPPIEIIRWRPKLREEDGTPVENGFGGNVLGEECWFTFDNRRLYCLQSAAARQWPRHVGAVVRVMYDIPTVRSAARKFRTTTLGRSVKICRRYDTGPADSWDWVQATGKASVSSAEADGSLARILQDVRVSDHASLCNVPAGILKMRPELRAAYSSAKDIICAAIMSEAPSNAATTGSNKKGQELLALIQGHGSVPMPFPDLAARDDAAVCEEDNSEGECTRDASRSSTGGTGSPCGALAHEPLLPGAQETAATGRQRRRRRSHTTNDPSDSMVAAATCDVRVPEEDHAPRGMIYAI